MTQNRLTETIQCLERVLPYVDHAIIVDGGSIDDTIITLRNWEKEEPKLKFYIHPWSDDFSKQRNEYLRRVPDWTWALISDPDEQFEIKTLENLRTCITEAEKRGKDMIGFLCQSVSLRGPKKVWETPPPKFDNYWKRLLFKKYPGIEYAGNPHEHLKNHPHQIMDTNLIYNHIKQDNVTAHRGARNMWVGGAGPNLGKENPHWVELRKICSELGFNDWHSFDAYMVRGNIDPRVKQWMRTFRHVQSFQGVSGKTHTDGTSEMREFWITYFEIYHPEEKEHPIDD